MHQPSPTTNLPVSPHAPKQSASRPTTIGWPYIQDSEKFKACFKQFIARHPVVFIGFPLLDGRPVDLHALHKEVMKMGGNQNVTANNLWRVVAARLGWVAIQGSAMEPPISTLQHAEYIEDVYMRMLSEFERQYMAAYRHQLAQHQGSQPRPAEQKPGQQNSERLVIFAHTSVDDMRAQGQQEKVIWMVEQNRVALQEVFASLSEPERDALLQQQRHATMQARASAHQEQISVGNHSTAPPRAQQPNPMVRTGAAQKPILMPTREQVNMASESVRQLKEFMMSTTIDPPPRTIPEHEREEFHKAFEDLWRYVQQLDRCLPYCLLFLAERDTMKKIIFTILMAQRQRNKLLMIPQSYILELVIVQQLILFTRGLWDEITPHMRAIMASSSQGGQR